MEEDSASKFIGKHQAVWQQQGFDYQYAVFLRFLMMGKLHDVVRYEQADDIIIDHEDGRTDLFQVKHSIDKNKKITNSSDDVWKSLGNWYDWVFTYNAGNKPLEKLRFVLVTNKNIDNELLKKIDAIRSGNAKSDELKTCLEKLSSFKNAKSICLKLLSNEKNILPFLMKINVEIIEDPYKDMYDMLMQQSVKGYSIENAFNEIVGRMSQKKMQLKRGQDLSMSVEKFKFSCQDIFQKLLLSPLTPMQVTEDKKIPNNYLSSNMIKQLLSIKVITEDDPNDPELAVAYRCYWCYENSIDTWMVKNHYLTEEIVRQLDLAFKNEWRVILKRSFRKCDNSECSIVECGYNCYIQTIDKEIHLNGNDIKKPFSSGWFLNLSNKDIPIVYWRKDWLEYRNNGKI